MDIRSPDFCETFDELKMWCMELYRILALSGYFEPAYGDINLGGGQLSKPAAANPGIDEFVDEVGADTGIETLAFAVDELISGSFELQHDYKEGTDLAFHVHWQGIAAPAGGTDNVKWQLTYTIARDTETLDACPAALVKETAITTQYKVYRSEFADIGGTNFKIGDQFLFMLKRIAASADEYAGDALLITCGIHYKRDGIGSRNIGTK